MESELASALVPVRPRRGPFLRPARPSARRRARRRWRRHLHALGLRSFSVQKRRGPPRPPNPPPVIQCRHLSSAHPQASTAASGPLVLSELRRNSVHLS